jgi:cell division septal protein FtsQ
MAVNLNPAIRYRSNSLISESDRFQRRKTQVRTRRPQSRIRVQPRHILISFFSLVLLFVALQQAWLFLIDWNGLEIEKVAIRCRKPDVQAAAEHLISGRRMGNLLLFDIGRLRRDLEAHRWVREVRVRRVFPSSINIEIRERAPEAVLLTSPPMLIDREGVRLDPAGPGDAKALPVFRDKSGFRRDVDRKLTLAWNCMDDLSTRQKSMIAGLDLTEHRNVVVELKGTDLRIKLGDKEFAAKMETYLRDRIILTCASPTGSISVGRTHPGRTSPRPERRPNNAEERIHRRIRYRNQESGRHPRGDH